MSHPGFNLKVRKVANGYTVHRTNIPGGKVADAHDDHVATDLEHLRELLEALTGQELHELASSDTHCDARIGGLASRCVYSTGHRGACQSHDGRTKPATKPVSGLPFSCLVFSEPDETVSSPDWGWQQHGVCGTLEGAKEMASKVAKQLGCKTAVVGTHAFHDWVASNDGPLMDLKKAGLQ